MRQENRIDGNKEVIIYRYKKGGKDRYKCQKFYK